MARTKKKKATIVMVRQDKNVPIEVSMSSFAEDNYSRYGRAVLENRAIPDYRDGLNPVNRRVLWSAHSLGFDNRSKLSKSARIVGDVIGRYHPHGDAAAYDAMVKMTNLPNRVNNIRVGLIEGGGNWGSLSGSSAAAARYTEARLSRFSDVVLFNKFYTPVMQKVPNFDSTTHEPLVLPALLPLLFLNGRFGIAPGATCNIPAFEGASVISLLEKVYSGEEITSKLLAKTLNVVTRFGGIENPATRKSEERKALFTTKRGKVNLISSYVYDDKKRTMTFDRFAIEDFEKVMEKGLTFEGVQTIYDLSKSDKKKPDRYGRLVFTLKKQMDNKHKKAVTAIENLMSLNENYVLNFTRRHKDELGQAAATMRAMTLVTAFTQWVKWRTNLERKACSYWILEDTKELRRLALLQQAVDLIDFIVKLLKDKKLKNNGEVFEAYAKHAKVEVEEAKYVLGRPIISLRNLEKADLQRRVDEVTANRAKLEKRKAKPEAFMLKQLEDFKPFFKGE